MLRAWIVNPQQSKPGCKTRRSVACQLGFGLVGVHRRGQHQYPHYARLDACRTRLLSDALGILEGDKRNSPSSLNAGAAEPFSARPFLLTY
jgi:hypothetical protein